MPSLTIVWNIATHRGRGECLNFLSDMPLPLCNQQVWECYFVQFKTQEGCPHCRGWRFSVQINEHILGASLKLQYRNHANQGGRLQNHPKTPLCSGHVAKIPERWESGIVIVKGEVGAPKQRAPGTQTSSTCQKKSINFALMGKSVPSFNLYNSSNQQLSHSQSVRN